jgi:hypothetical protein
VIVRRGEALGACSAGEITNVTQVFQPSGRFCAAETQSSKSRKSVTAAGHEESATN